MAEGAFVLLEVAPVVECVVVVEKAVDGDDLSGVGEEGRVNFETGVRVVFIVELDNLALELGGFDGAVVDDDDDKVLLVLAVSIKLCFRGE